MLPLPAPLASETSIVRERIPKPDAPEVEPMPGRTLIEHPPVEGGIPREHDCRAGEHRGKLGMNLRQGRAPSAFNRFRVSP